jgi:hypothetical protein
MENQGSHDAIDVVFVYPDPILHPDAKLKINPLLKEYAC